MIFKRNAYILVETDDHGFRVSDKTLVKIFQRLLFIILYLILGNLFHIPLNLKTISPNFLDILDEHVFDDVPTWTEADIIFICFRKN